MNQNSNTSSNDPATPHVYPLDPFINSVIIERLKELKAPFKIAFLDIDSTVTGPIELTNRVKSRLYELGYALVYVTARTEEMLMSKYQYDKSVKLGFDRPRPRLGKRKNTRYYIPPEDIEPTSILDCPIIATSSGTRILFRQQNGGYILDSHYQDRFNQSPIDWQKQTLELLEVINQGKLFSISPVSLGILTKADVFPPEYRIQLNFENVEQKIEFKKKVTQLKKDGEGDFSNIRITDDSNPFKGQFSVYLTPLAGSKKTALERIINSLAKRLEIKNNRFEILIAGDSYPDLEMGLFAALNIKGTFLVVGGSPLSRSLIEDINDFAGENITPIKQNLSGRNGIYKFKLSDMVYRRVVIGDELFPGTKGPETILAYLETI